jgi:hypothetical protein
MFFGGGTPLFVDIDPEIGVCIKEAVSAEDIRHVACAVLRP